mmetsp:Transcript_54326/g.151260  ORF Transcript_54326/g.151260 Transcript_54326/m.151260 type:complete len:293 (-) Transcript_54326:2329-3207(-)
MAAEDSAFHQRVAGKPVVAVNATTGLADRVKPRDGLTIGIGEHAPVGVDSDAAHGVMDDRRNLADVKGFVPLYRPVTVREDLATERSLPRDGPAVVLFKCLVEALLRHLEVRGELREALHDFQEPFFRVERGVPIRHLRGLPIEHEPERARCLCVGIAAAQHRTDDCLARTQFVGEALPSSVQYESTDAAQKLRSQRFRFVISLGRVDKTCRVKLHLVHVHEPGTNIPSDPEAVSCGLRPQSRGEVLEIRAMPSHEAFLLLPVSPEAPRRDDHGRGPQCFLGAVRLDYDVPT